jgi:hypothetical protein
MKSFAAVSNSEFRITAPPNQESTLFRGLRREKVAFSSQLSAISRCVGWPVEIEDLMRIPLPSWRTD